MVIFRSPFRDNICSSQFEILLLMGVKLDTFQLIVFNCLLKSNLIRIVLGRGIILLPPWTVQKLMHIYVWDTTRFGHKISALHLAQWFIQCHLSPVHLDN